MRKIRYTKVMFLKLMPMYILCAVVLFFLIYQTAIGNRFLEDLHPSLVLGGFLALFMLSIGLLSTFSIRERSGRIFLRMGLYTESFSINEIVNIKVPDNFNYTYGVSKKGDSVIFRFSRRKKGLEITLSSGKRILILGDDLSKVLTLTSKD